MADVTISSVAIEAGADQVRNVTLGETCAAFDFVYVLSTDQRVYQADCLDAAKDDVEYLLLTGGDAGDPAVALLLPRSHDQTLRVNISSGLTAGTVYVLSVSGNMAPFADLATNDYIVILGCAETTAIINLRKARFDVLKP